MGRFHVVDDHCGIAGGEDFGAFDTREQAEQAIADRRAMGDKGGCRCGGLGYLIQTCEERVSNHLAWDKHRESEAYRFSYFRDFDSESRIDREPTPEEMAEHKCYDYDPERFEEKMQRNRRKNMPKWFFDEE